jgi:ribosomal protein S18 acetylase RimI-like enzyme
MQQITHLETLTTSAWPALATEIFDAWVLRFARGYTKRANSVTPLAVGALPDEEKIAYCEQRYAAQNQPAIFKLTAASQTLDEVLAARGYSQIDLSSVQQRSLLNFSVGRDSAVRMDEDVSDSWFAQFAELNQVAAQHRAAAQQMLASYVCPTQFAALYQGDQAVACGFAIIQQNTLVLYDIVSASQQRRQGYALRLIHQLLAWGKDNGASSAVLQVVVANEAAMALYAKLGFTEQYRYWYRRQPV